jgi:hypothetical protein
MMRGNIASGRIKLIAVTSESRCRWDPKADLVHNAIPVRGLLRGSR